MAGSILEPIVEPLKHIVEHPYYPLDITVIGYVANDMGRVKILGIFGTGLLIVGGGTFFLCNAINPGLRKRDRWLAVWFALCGAIHLLVEGYFSINHKAMGPGTHYLGQGWKEYSKSDSRYMTADSFVVCMESITAFAWGPLSLAIVWMIIKDSPWRHPTSALVSTGQFYGLILYFATNFFDESFSQKVYYRPEPYYYWVYYIMLNGPWLIVPVYATWVAAKETAAAFRVRKQVTGSSTANGRVNASTKKHVQ